jgi:hypothetical protein
MAGNFVPSALRRHYLSVVSVAKERSMRFIAVCKLFNVYVCDLFENTLVRITQVM